MKNLFKRIITTILVLTMVMGFNVPFSATTVMAASITYNVSSTIKGVLTDDGVLTISGTGAMPDYTKIANIPWYKDRDRISEVRVNSGITSIGEANFNSCYNMTKVTVASTVTSIGDGAFADTKLQSYTGMERVKTFGDYVFQGTDLDDFEFPGETTEIGNYIFYNSSVKRIVIPKSVTTIKDGIGYKLSNTIAKTIAIRKSHKNASFCFVNYKTFSIFFSFCFLHIYVLVKIKKLSNTLIVPYPHCSLGYLMSLFRSAPLIR